MRTLKTSMVITVNDDYEYQDITVTAEEAKETMTMIENLVMGDSDFMEQAAKWWNSDTSSGLKATIVAMSYYEYLSHSAQHPEDLLEDNDD